MTNRSPYDLKIIFIVLSASTILKIISFGMITGFFYMWAFVIILPIYWNVLEKCKNINVSRFPGWLLHFSLLSAAGFLPDTLDIGKPYTSFGIIFNYLLNIPSGYIDYFGIFFLLPSIILIPAILYYLWEVSRIPDTEKSDLGDQ